MKTKDLFPIALATALVMSCASQDKTIDKQDVLRKLSLEDKAHFVIGTGMPGMSGDHAVIGATKSLVPGAAGTTYPLDSLGIPAIVLADGPAGLRVDAHRKGDKRTYFCTHFPIGTLLASTWNRQLVEEVGKAMGEEVKEYGVDVLLAPAVNIHRNPLNGRNFEYYSEDPVVAGKIAAAYIRGIQSNGVGTSVKHFAFNNQETNRMNNDARISQRAIREIYLKPFEIAVKEAHPWTVMSSYNKINGIYTSESKDLLTTILRDEWGYEGTVMTDWFGGKDGAAQVWAGNDMLQPGKAEQFMSIVDGVKSGRLKEADLDRNIIRILNLIEKTPSYQGYQPSNKPDLQGHAAVTRQSAVEGMVLLKNEDSTLPLASKATDIEVALYGCTGYDFIAGGTGSGNVNHAYVVSLLDGLKKAGYRVNEDLHKQYAKYITQRKAEIEKQQNAAAKKDKKKAMLAKFMPTPRPVEMSMEARQLERQARLSDVAIVTLGRISGEFVDRKMADFNLSTEERRLVSQVCEAYHKVGKKVVVLLNVGGVIETASWKDLPDAILCAWQAGQESGNSVADVLSGKVSPSGKLTMTWPVNFADAYSSRNFPIDKAPDLSLTNQGKAGNGEKDVDYTDYEEDIYVGYRYFDSFDKAVSYPFGYGLSYTKFDYTDAKINAKDDVINVTVSVKNVGKADGKEIVELYVAAPDSKRLNKPAKELKAFAKTKSLKPGEAETLTLTVKTADLASFDADTSVWRVDAGKYQLLVGASSRDIKTTLPIDVKARETKVHSVLRPMERFNILKRM
ncbi:glycoside hydrolase family 3 C-terminal domain-containing protein [Prevotella sp. A2931]|uniref:Glycoside hydrolase family 3 C-terminal domain-containing protein n=1 Tax=Prevotella illustrans TaxID=2800387 RepID=A0ABS3M413_9BACT|nr:MULTISPECIES: glycoside hydrolase family 3 N-terminal domain-containing protein [Prevotella]MBO1362860.1 glycoside hydrolase family 3 C-terminal domain-containing protein [Prevotella illustrans]PTL25926.1 glycosyl hydrolase [Prevotella sp. oral taxon 820]